MPPTPMRQPLWAGFALSEQRQRSTEDGCWENCRANPLWSCGSGRGSQRSRYPVVRIQPDGKHGGQGHEDRSDDEYGDKAEGV